MHDSCMRAAKALAVLHPLWVSLAPWRIDHSMACEPLWVWASSNVYPQSKVRLLLKETLESLRKEKINHETLDASVHRSSKGSTE